MVETREVEIGSKTVEVTVDDSGATAEVVDLSEFGRAIEPFCNRVRQHDHARNDGVAHFADENAGDIIRAIAEHDITVVVHEGSVREQADHFISWSEN